MPKRTVTLNENGSWDAATQKLPSEKALIKQNEESVIELTNKVNPPQKADKKTSTKASK